MQITSKQGQWIGDVAIREAGSIEAMIAMAIRNDVSVTDSLPAGTMLTTPESIDRRTMNFYKRNDINAATTATPDAKVFGGIGHMSIGISFIVS